MTIAVDLGRKATKTNKLQVLKVQDFGNFELSPMCLARVHFLQYFALFMGLVEDNYSSLMY